MNTADRCKETSTTTGVGDITLLGAVTQFQSFATAFPSFPATISYAIVGQTGSEWEVGVGTLTDATTLERTTVQDSSNAGAAVNFSAGTKDVFATLTAQDLADITTALAGKAASAHTHAAGDITGLATSATTDTTDATNINAGTLADARLSSNVVLENATNDFTAAQEISVNGAASTPALKLDGTIFTGGTGTTTKPLFLVEPAGATSTGWSTSGTLLGLNGPSGFTGRVISGQVNGTEVFSVSQTGSTVIGGNFSSTSGNISLTAAAGMFLLNSGTGIGRNSSGVVEINSGTAGTFRDIKVRNVIADNTVQLKGFTVATLPAGTVGMTAYVTDATAPTYLGALTGGGAVVCPVFYNGSAWVSH